jgi:enoyl-CoA hydratase
MSAEEIVRYELRDAVAVVHFDDGKANALSHAAIAALGDALDRAEKDEARALALFGRPGRFSAGFDLAVMGQGGEAMIELVRCGAELGLRIYEFACPVVAGCTGHALAMGALLLLCSDTRVGAEGEFKIGLNEVAIGLPLPFFAIELAKARLSRRHLTRAVAEAEIYAPRDAVDAGWLDRVAAPEALTAEVLAEATRLSALDARAHAASKRLLRADTAAAIRASLT